MNNGKLTPKGGLWGIATKNRIKNQIRPKEATEGKESFCPKLIIIVKPIRNRQQFPQRKILPQKGHLTPSYATNINS